MIELTITMEEERYSNRQIERMLENQSADLKDHIDRAIKPVYEQVVKTNGRVTTNEADIVAYKVWRGWMTGGMAVIMIILPILITFLSWMAIQVLSFDTKIRTAVDETFQKNLEVNP